jgi:hypothetical protein
MTRDEAIYKFSHTRLHMFGERKAESWIDVFEALGMLKLDEPNFTGKLVSELSKIGVSISHLPIDVALERADLKIVEKDRS